MSEKPKARWYTADDDGNQSGPFTWDEFKKLYLEEKITSKTSVWHRKVPAWTDIGKVQGLIPKLEGLLDQPSFSFIFLFINQHFFFLV